MATSARNYVVRGDRHIDIRPPDDGSVIRFKSIVLKGSTGNTAHAQQITGEITAFAISDGGSGYTAAATRAIITEDSRRVEAAVTVASGAITAITVPTGDDAIGWGTATVTFEGDGSGAVATATITTRTLTVVSTTGTTRSSNQYIADRMWWMRLEADHANDWAIAAGQVVRSTDE